jgi:hypothetical protein
MRRPSNPMGERTNFLGRREMCERTEHERENKRIKWIKIFFTECYSIMYLYFNQNDV